MHWAVSHAFFGVVAFNRQLQSLQVRRIVRTRTLVLVTKNGETLQRTWLFPRRVFVCLISNVSLQIHCIAMIRSL